MACSWRIPWWGRPAAWAALVLTPVALSAAHNRPTRPPEGELVEIFSGMDHGQLDVRLIPKDEKQCRLLVKNKTDRPLCVQLPPAFAGVPVLAQWDRNMDFDLNFDRNNVPQAIGTGPGRGINGFMNPGVFMNPGMMNLRGRQPGRPQGDPLRPFLFSVPPEKIVKLRLRSVCLDFGKPNPRPRIEYQLKPIDSHTDKPGVAELCAMLGQGKISQQAAQLAAWHLHNELSWERLAKIRDKVTFGSRPRYSRRELESAKQAAEKALKVAKDRSRPENGKPDSLSRR